MARGPKKQSNTSVMFFFAGLGLLLLGSTMMPSFNSRQGLFFPQDKKPDPKAHAHFSPAPPLPAPAKSTTSPTPPAKPATPTPPPPPPPHH